MGFGHSRGHGRQVLVLPPVHRLPIARPENCDDAPGEALFTFITRMVEQAAQKRTVVGLLAEAGIDLQVADSVQLLREGIEALLTRSQRAGTVREDIHLDEVIALLTGVCQGALHAGWDRDLQRRTLAIVFEGLRPFEARGGAARTYS
ncbi:hypothetical protein AB0M44_33145 [Streptosporangium subroseum]|uniref:SbtR family transcriptional regulator n=1 Tax=Streptosporangium subroseum TaxID=106412 RepID=UPI0034272196